MEQHVWCACEAASPEVYLGVKIASCHMLCCSIGSSSIRSAERISSHKRQAGYPSSLILFLRRSVKMRRVSSLNDLVNFRQALQIRTPGSLDRPKSVVLNEDQFGADTRSCNSDEYEDADLLFRDKKEPHSSLKRLGSALHASFRKIRQKGAGKDESGYETLPFKQDSWEKRSFRHLLSSSKKWMGSKSPVPNKTRSGLVGKKGSEERDVSQSETSLLVPAVSDGPVLNYDPPCNGGSPHVAPTRTVSVSSGISIPISVYSDYEIPDEVLEASIQPDTPPRNSPHRLLSEPSQSTLSVDNIAIPKSRSAHEISNLGSDSVVFRQRANSQSHSDRSKHDSCLIDYSPSSSRASKVKLKRKGVLSRSFNRSFNRKKHGKSISDILGTPPAVPTTRRPSILCKCCNSVHVCQTLPGMSLTRSAAPISSSSTSAIYENTRLSLYGDEKETVENEVESDYETLPGVTPTVQNERRDPDVEYETVTLSEHTREEGDETDYEDVDIEATSLTQITSTLTQISSPDNVTSLDNVTSASPDSVTTPDSVSSSLTDSVFVTSPTFVTSSDCAISFSERELIATSTCTDICSTPVLISPGEISISLEL